MDKPQNHILSTSSLSIASLLRRQIERRWKEKFFVVEVFIYKDIKWTLFSSAATSTVALLRLEERKHCSSAFFLRSFSFLKFQLLINVEKVLGTLPKDKFVAKTKTFECVCYTLELKQEITLFFYEYKRFFPFFPTIKVENSHDKWWCLQKWGIASATITISCAQYNGSLFRVRVPIAPSNQQWMNQQSWYDK